MELTHTTEEQRRNYFFLVRLILAVLVLGLCVFELFLSFRGLDQPAAMDQAQIARQIARGEGRTTKFLRPLEVMDQSRAVDRRSEGALGTKLDNTGKPVLDFDHFVDTNHAPLHSYVLAVALKMAGYDHFEAKRMDAEVSNIYGGDRVVAGVSMLFFLISLVMAYILFTSVFDEVVAATTVAFLGLSKLMLGFAVSGLAQPMLTCMALGVAYFVVAAVKADARGSLKLTIVYNVLAFALVIAMCLTNSLCVWAAVGLLVFSIFAYRHIGLQAGIGLGMLLLGYVLPLHFLCAPMGGTTAKFLHSIYFAFGSGSGEALMRASDASAIPFNSANFYLRLLGYVFDQIGNLYDYMGGIVVVPFFLLALFNRYKRQSAEALKWAVFAMWVGASIGMACFAEKGADSSDQLFIIFAPFFAAYGTALVFNFIARMQLAAGFNAARALAIAVMLLFSSGSFLFELPQQLSFSILTSARGIPHYPPYYPAALNGKLCDMSNEQDVIISDQPWAVAWYSDRKSLWLPRSLDTLNRDVQPVLDRSGQAIQGILITPSSHGAEVGISGMMAANGDFAPLVLEGKLLQMVPKHNMAFVELFNTQGNSQVKSRPLASLVSTQGVFAHRNFLLGADIVYYSRDNQDFKQH